MKKKFFCIIWACLCLTFIAEGAAPTGYYYYARGKKQAALKTTLQEISSPLFLLKYGSGEGATWQGFYKTDRNADNTVQDMYSDIVRSFNGFNSISEMAIEHSFPKSWWGGYENYAYRDLFHLYPADAYTNGIKNNFPLGEVTGTPLLDNGKSKVGSNGFGGVYVDNCFEPADEYKGDFARSYLYIATIYEHMKDLWSSPMLTNTVYPVFTPWAVDLLLKWNKQDPVSEKELNRNDSVYSIQGNRNPFIDFPELAEYIWGKDTLNAFNYPAESGAFLISPRRKFAMDFGVIFQNVVKKMSFTLQGVNITSAVSLSLAQNNPYIQLSTNLVSAADVIGGKSIEVLVAPLESGLFLDTLLIQGGGLAEATRIPLKILATSEFITTEPTDITPVGGTLHWLEDPQATDYTVSLYQGDTQAGDLIISGYYEGTSNDKALELYNGTGATVDLSKYSLKKQSNGAGDYAVTYKLSGMLANNKTYVIVNNPSTNSQLRAKANLFTDSITAFNGNDAVALFRNGVLIDVAGQLNGGADYYWGLDKMLKRKADITHPSNEFSLSDWVEYPYSQMDKFGVHSMNLTSESQFVFKDKPVGTANQLVVENLAPLQNYTYSVTSNRNGIALPSVNTQWLRTSRLEAPITLEASNVASASFTANWEESPYAEGYYLDVYRLEGQTTRSVFDFNAVGNNGKPLPEGWTGTASGNYTTTASSGLNPNSIALKNTGEWLQTPTYNDIVTSLDFMYRFPSSGGSSYLTVEANNGTNWVKIDSLPYVNTSKTYPSYTFPQSAGYVSVRFTYTKTATSNLSIDDVMITHGNTDTTFIVKNKAVQGNNATVNGLKENTEYLYRLRARLGDSFSDYSQVTAVKTVAASGLQNNFHKNYRMYVSSSGVNIQGLNGHEIIRVFTVNGTQVAVSRSKTNEDFIPLHAKGVYILQVIDKGHMEVFKIVK